MKYTKEQITKAFLLYLNDTLPLIECKKVKEEGNWNCDRCDNCIMEQYINKVKEHE